MQWRGIMINGAMRKGACFVQDHASLDATLFKQGIALIDAKQPRFFYYRKKISRKQQAIFFDHLSILLNAGIQLPDAVTLAAHDNTLYCQEVAHTVAHHVRRGVSLVHAFDAYTSLFDPIVRQLMYLGHTSETVAASCAAAATYLKDREQFFQELRAALILPCITTLFVISLTIGIFTCIVPYFATLLTSLHHQLPPLSRTVLTISNFMHSNFGLSFIGAFLLSCLLGYRLLSRVDRCKTWFDYGIMYVPYIGTIIKHYLTGYACTGLALLLDHGISLSTALDTLAQSADNRKLKNDIKNMHHLITTGISFDSACAISSFFHDQHTQTFARIGHESGTMPHALSKAGLFHLTQAQRSLRTITMVIQPLLLIFLGLIVAMIIIGLYEPILTLTAAF
jgi:type IV pilus assembly protein PilC